MVKTSKIYKKGQKESPPKNLYKDILLVYLGVNTIVLEARNMSVAEERNFKKGCSGFLHKISVYSTPTVQQPTPLPRPTPYPPLQRLL